MANENEDIKKEGTSNADGDHKEPEHKHQSIIGKIVESIEDAIEEMSTDFPLSGGEEHPVHHKHHKKEEPKEEKKDEQEEHHKKSSFFHDLETDFPLSGGEV